MRCGTDQPPWPVVDNPNGGVEHVGEADPAIHAAALRSRVDWIHGLVDPAAMRWLAESR